MYYEIAFSKKLSFENTCSLEFVKKRK